MTFSFNQHSFFQFTILASTHKIWIQVWSIILKKIYRIILKLKVINTYILFSSIIIQAKIFFNQLRVTMGRNVVTEVLVYEAYFLTSVTILSTISFGANIGFVRNRCVRYYKMGQTLRWDAKLRDCMLTNSPLVVLIQLCTL